MVKKFLMWLKRLVIVFITLIIVLLIVTSTTFDFMIHYGRYADVIDQARELTAKTDDTVYFNGNWSYDISGLNMGTNVCAKKLEDGTLFVRILVEDGHRLGKSGLVYTENDLASRRDVEMALDTYGCGEWTSTGGIWGSWWAIENNLG